MKGFFPNKKKENTKNNVGFKVSSWMKGKEKNTYTHVSSIGIKIIAHPFDDTYNHTTNADAHTPTLLLLHTYIYIHIYIYI